MFQLIFRGECQPGTEISQARNNARALFKASVEQVDRMFSGRPVVIRNRLEQDQAEKYRAVLARHGLVAYVEPMAAEPKTQATTPSATSGRQPQSQPSSSTPSPAPAAGGSPGTGPAIEPGDRLPVAGDRVDEVLAGSSLGLDPVGTPLEDHEEVAAPMFEHLDEWSLAPPGTDLGVDRDLPPPVVPDVSHLSLVDEQDDRSSNH